MIEQRPELCSSPRGHVHTVEFAEDARVQVEVGGIAVVVGGSLEVDAVRPDVPAQLPQENPPPGPPPARSTFEFWEQGPKIHEP